MPNHLAAIDIPMKRQIALSLLLLPLLACGAGRSVYYLWDAQREFARAEESGAAQKAVFEYTMARQYLLKAREEAGYSDYQAAEDLARKSMDWSSQASDIAEFGSSERDLLLDGMDELVPNDVRSGD